MTEKTEWEVVDGPAHGRQQTSQQTRQRTMASLLGPLWRWKLAGVIIIATMALLFVAAIAGTIAVLIAAGALVSLGVGKVRRWLRRDNSPATL